MYCTLCEVGGGSGQTFSGGASAKKMSMASPLPLLLVMTVGSPRVMHASLARCLLILACLDLLVFVWFLSRGAAVGLLHHRHVHERAQGEGASRAGGRREEKAQGLFW